MILSEADARALIGKALALASADEVSVSVWGGREGNTRFAVNSVTTCGDEDALGLAVSAWFGKRHATATTTETDDAALARVVGRAEELARIAPEDPEYVPLLGPQEYLPIQPWVEGTAKATPEAGAAAVRSAVELAEAEGVTAAGFFTHGHSFRAMGNSLGLFNYTRFTDASYSVTARTADGRGSGWAADNSRDIAEVDFARASRRAVQKAAASREPKTLEPGVYPVVLEPQAVADFLGYAIWSMNARQADEGRSFYARRGGGNKIGERIAGENITLRSDPAHPQLLGNPVSIDGLPAKPRTWIERGVLQQLAYDRFWALKQGKEPTGPPTDLVLEGGTGTLDDLIRETDRAILVTRFWYIRSLDPQTILVTGLTRDGVFWIEDGEVRHSVRNFRFNESPIAVLNKVTGLSQPVRVGHALIPALRASEFTFSSRSDAV